MSREIKFRAWDGVSFIKWNVLSEFNDHAYYLALEAADKTDSNLMQYTGLKDKNGVEIYEGDIISEPVSPVGGEDGGYLYKNRVVKWHGASCGYRLYCPYAASSVIGNIHENPELL